LTKCFIFKVKNELDKLFETIQEGDKTSLANAAEVILREFENKYYQYIHIGAGF
jgi:hypothetical protein